MDSGNSSSSSCPQKCRRKRRSSLLQRCCAADILFCLDGNFQDISSSFLSFQRTLQEARAGRMLLAAQLSPLLHVLESQGLRSRSQCAGPAPLISDSVQAVMSRVWGQEAVQNVHVEGRGREWLPLKALYVCLSELSLDLVCNESLYCYLGCKVGEKSECIGWAGLMPRGPTRAFPSCSFEGRTS